MKSEKRLSYLYHFLMIWNFLIVLFIAYVSMSGVYWASQLGKAREFLNIVSVVPKIPWQLPIKASILYGLLILTIYIKRKWEVQNKTAGYILAFFEILLCIFVLLTLNLCYSGVIMIVVVDLASYAKGNKNSIYFLMAVVIIYILADYDLLSLFLNMIPFQSYLAYYDTEVQNYLMGLKSVFTSVNLIAFIAYMLILMQYHMQENERIQSLNQSLNDANERLQEMNLQLQDYAEKTAIIAETKERNRLAREIHDTLGHALTGIIVGVDACITMIDISPEVTKKQLHVISDVARQGIKDVRRSVNKLRPDVLEDQPLEEALRKMTQEMGAAAHAEVHFDSQVDVLKFSSDEEDAIYRVVQEGLTNAIRHGKATEVFITITQKDGVLALTMKDNGIGCANIKKGFGLQHMKERVQLLNGDITYDGTDGFMIQANIPIRWGE